MKRILLLFLVLSLGLAGCTWLDTPTETLTVVTTPSSGYPPLDVTIQAHGVGPGQFSYEVEGKTYEQPENILDVEIVALPCTVTVTWLDGGDPQEATVIIGLKNTGPVPGRLVLNFIPNLWTLHAKQRYIVTYPSAYDPEGGPVKLISATVEWGSYGELAVFCPPYTGAHPWDGTVDEYHVRLDTGHMIYNAFLFIQGWPKYIDGALKLFISPPSWSMTGYPMATTDCGPFWPRDTRNGTNVIVTSVWEDEQGATTLDIQTIPANPYIGCGVQTPSAVCP